MVYITWMVPNWPINSCHLVLSSSKRIEHVTSLVCLNRYEQLLICAWTASYLLPTVASNVKRPSKTSGTDAVPALALIMPTSPITSQRTVMRFRGVVYVLLVWRDRGQGVLYVEVHHARSKWSKDQTDRPWEKSAESYPYREISVGVYLFSFIFLISSHSYLVEISCHLRSSDTSMRL